MARTDPPPRPPRKVLSEKSVAACMVALEELGQELLDGEITVSEFEATFKEEMKSEYITQYLFGIGGLAYMTGDDWAQVAVDLEKQYKFAENYIDELEAAKEEDKKNMAAFLALTDGMSDDEASDMAAPASAVAALLWRLGLYADSAGTVYEGASEAAHKRDGFTLEVWNLDDGVENHCPTCPEFAAMGAQPIGTFPEPGDGHTECGNKCHCWKTYINASGEED